MRQGVAVMLAVGALVGCGSGAREQHTAPVRSAAFVRHAFAKRGIELRHFGFGDPVMFTAVAAGSTGPVLVWVEVYPSIEARRIGRQTGGTVGTAAPSFERVARNVVVRQDRASRGVDAALRTLR